MFKSRFTPNATGDEVDLRIGEIVSYDRQGAIIQVQIDSERKTHAQCENLGYEAIWMEENRRIFIDGKKITQWKGKMNSLHELDANLNSNQS